MQVKRYTIGFDEAIAEIKRLVNDEPNFKREFLQKLADMLLFRIQSFAPRKTGKYAASWKIVEVTDTKAEVSTDMPDLYLILELGTKGHKIKGKPILRFELPNGQVVIARFVRHPGTEPRPHVRIAFNDTMRDIPDILIQILRENFPWLQ